ncbi:zinc-binding dehydrogenase [Conexibacter sp. JD483]|uniref:quinone oxidoreductase family protein n=1 Tax=unclassified Conexibacter TaxID=2627773 RepID=UPI0027253083|nr:MULTISPECIES: zinc-binding dehydrogenase [unclassified Conexibacter]MDO8187809.1 zinc-binding dehydrogenase [Conexibacter sp. CPCC 205706]MDO8199982.1 zinc-binding dehydrogenase [Conexibacter sp. CPCC 205762]MDR9369509.1 zinc-binding dehydrogenase [Conexibacter sp. JD483]
MAETTTSGPAERRLVALRRFGAPAELRWTTGPLPPRGDDDVHVAVAAIGVNFADTMVRRGEYRRDQPLSFTPGFEVAGRVVAGPAGGPPPGSRVVAFTEHGGGYADHVVVPRERVYAVADGVSLHDAAALFTQGVTGWYAVHRYGRLARGETVLVHAAGGGLGGLCVQLAAEAGATVIATASTEAKRTVAREHGAALALAPDPQALTAAVREATGGRGADVVLDGVGGPLFAASLRALAFNGRYVVVGSASQQPATLDTRALMPRGQTISGFVVARVAEQDPAEPQRAFDAIQERLLDGRLRPRVTILPVAEAARAHKLIESRQATGKLVLSFD